MPTDSPVQRALRAARAEPATLGDVLDMSAATAETIGILLSMVLDPGQLSEARARLAELNSQGLLSSSDGTQSAAVGLFRGLGSPHANKEPERKQ